MRVPYICALLVLTIVPHVCAAKPAKDETTTQERYRTWTSKSGTYTIEAEFVEFRNGKVWVRSKNDGNIIGVSPGDLSDDDRKWYREEIKSRRDAATESHPSRAAMAKEFTNSIGMKFKPIMPGEFMMGAPDLPKSSAFERPQHRVRITRPFFMGVTEVTQEQYEQVMGKNPSENSKTGSFADAPVVKGLDTSSFPVENVNWYEAVEFCSKLSAKEGRTYRLPTEAQWEYACRAGSTTTYCFGDDVSLLREYSWHRQEGLQGQMHPVGQKKPNAWGLYDLHGSVSEWCQDWWDQNQDYYANSPTDDPPGPMSGMFRIIRGGGNTSARDRRSSYRHRQYPIYRQPNVGFRVIRELPPGVIMIK